MTTEAVTAPRRPAPGHGLGDTVRLLLRGIGQTFITIGVVLLLFVVYTLYITNIFAAQDQQALGHDLDKAFSQTPPAATAGPVAEAPLPELGDAFARMYIPSIGLEKVVVEGVGVADLKKGPGHYPDTALPGEVGNTVVSGHRTTYGAPFNSLGDLKVGDPIVVETATAYYTYGVTSQSIVKPDAIEVTYPVPGQKGAVPTLAQITLTTCHPKYSAKQRMIIHGTLTETTLKSTGQRPTALKGR